MQPSSKQIEDIIYYIRGQKVMLDFDLAALYEVETKALNQAVKRNIDRFPADFRFQVSETEGEILRSQIVTAKPATAKSRFLPFAYTELGIAMLSSVLKSDRAIQVHISIIRVLFRMREMIKANENLAEQLRSLENNSNKLFKIVFERIDALEVKELPHAPKRKIGF